MIQISLSDTTGTSVLEAVEVPLIQETIEGAVDVETLSYDVYTDFITTKRLWTHKWAYMSLADYQTMIGYYERQFTLFQYPQLSISELGIDNITVRMTVNPKRIIDNCQTVQDVTVSWRETKQNLI